MKKLQNILAVFLCISVLSGCQYVGFEKKQPAETKYIPQESPKQMIKQEPPKSLEQKTEAEVMVAPANSIKIALLVPLSGTYKELGQGMLDAAQLAMFRIGNSSITIVPYDTKDSPYTALDAAKKAISEGSKIILGPVFSNAAKAIAKVAMENNIQVVSFSNDNSLAGTGIFAIGLLPEQQVRRITEFAVSRGIKNFETLLPSDTYGTIVTKELRKVVEEQQGVSITKNRTYQTDSQGKSLNIDGHVQAIVESANKNKPGEPSALLLPSNLSAANEILNTLSKNNFDKSKIQLLGNDQWQDPSILTNPALEGSWFTALPRERRNDYESKFLATYGHIPPKLSSLAYDGVALAATIAKISGGEIFSRETLTNPRGFVGVDGIFRLREDGLVERGFAIMGIKGGGLVMIDPAPTSFVDSQ